MRGYVIRCEKGGIIFNERDHENEMFFVLMGRVAIRKGDREIAVMPQGKSFDGLTFLLASKYRARWRYGCGRRTR